MDKFFLFAYSSVATAALAVTVLGRASNPRSPTFDEVTVRRLNVVEPDGTPRLIISDRAALPGTIVRGEENLTNGHSRVCSSTMTRARSGGPGVRRAQERRGPGGRFRGQPVVRQVRSTITNPATGGHRADSASVALMDADGGKRIVMQVLKDGTAGIQFLDEHGKVVKQLTPWRTLR